MGKRKQILFLDIDGVLNTDSFLKENWKGRDVPDYSIYIQTELVSELNRILSSSQHVKVVIHSSWGRALSLEQITSALVSKGFAHAKRVLGVTPKKFSSHKLHEIGLWLSDNPKTEEFLVIDDDYIAVNILQELRPHMRATQISTDSSAGLTPEISEQIILWFKAAEFAQKP
jgi:hypothetical protein